MNKFFPSIAAAVACYFVSKAAESSAVKAAALGALGAVVLNQIPYLKQAI